jgi:hypothetical protein
MNSHSPYHSTSTDMFLKRVRTWKRQYLHVVIYTSLFWICVDVFFIMLFTDCTREVVLPCPSSASSSSMKLLDKQVKFVDQTRRPHPRMLLDKFQHRNESIVVSSTSTRTSTTTENWWNSKPGKHSTCTTNCRVRHTEMCSFQEQRIQRVGKEKAAVPSSYRRT